MNKNVTIYQSNAFTQARYEFNVVEKRIIFQIIRHLNKLSEKGLQKDLFGGVQITLTDKELGVLGDKTNVYRSLETLRTRVYSINTEDEWKVFGIYNEIEHKKKSGIWNMTIGKAATQQFLSLSKNYTEYSLSIAMSLRSEYTQRFFEFCNQYKSVGGWQTTVKELRHKMVLEFKYAKYAAFKKYVLEVAKKELKKSYDRGESNVYFRYSEKKTGRAVTNLYFKIISRNKNEVKASIDDVIYLTRTALNSIFDVDKKPKNKEFVKKTMAALILEPDKLNHCYQKIEFTKKNKDKSEWQKYMRYVINQEYLD